ncbi:MAG: hypothetical protein ALAOOOJD_02727 [bacterium]|nr:hypothetical protein [bacterium]
MLKRLFKIFIFAATGFIFLLILIGGLTQTAHFKDWLRDELEQQAGALLNGKLHLGRIEGNLVSNFRFLDLCIELDSDTLLYIAKIEAGLRPLELLNQEVSVTKLIFHAPFLALQQRPDSTWNVASLLKPSADQKTASLWRFALQNVQIDSGTLALTPLDTLQKLLPRRIQNISTNLRLDYAEPLLNVRLRNLQLTSLYPPLQLDTLAAQLFWSGDSLQIKNLKMCSQRSRLTGQITLWHLARPIFNVDLNAAPLYGDDLRAFFPQLPLHGPVQGVLHAQGDAQHTQTTFHLQHADGRAEGNFYVLFDSTQTAYGVEAAVSALNLNPYFPRLPGPTQLNFKISLEGAGLRLNELKSHLVLDVDSSRVLGRTISRLHLIAEARDQQIQTRLSASSPAGELELSGKIVDPQRQQLFELNAEARHLNLAQLFQNDTLDSDLSFRLQGAGQHFDSTRRVFDGTLQVSPSRVPGVLIEKAYCQFHARHADVQLDTLEVATSFGSIQAGGVLSWRYTNNFHFRAELGDLTWVKRAVEADTLRAGGVLSGNATGPLDSLAVFSRFDLRKVQYNRTFMDRLAGTFSFRRAGDTGGGFIQGRADKMLLAVVPVDSMKAVVYYDLTRAQLAADFWQGEKNTGKLEGDYTFGEIGRFDLARCEINVLGQRWQTPPGQAMWIDVGDDDYDFHHCVLAFDNQRFYLDGRLSYVGAENLQFKLEGIDIAALLAVLRNGNGSSKATIAGVIAGEGAVTGTADSPIVHGNLTWNDGRVTDFAFEKWTADFDYADERFTWQFKLYQTPERFLTGDGYLPMNLSLNNTGAVLYRDRPMRIQAATTDIDLAFLQTLTNRVKQVQGKLFFDVHLENTWSAPHSKGAVGILDGAFSVPEYGVSYDDVQLKLSIDTSVVKLVDFHIRSDKGEIGMTGNLQRTPETITEASAELTAKDFLLVRNRNMELRLAANIKGSSDARGPRYRGDITVERSRFFLPAFQQRAVIELSESTTKTAADTAHPVIANLDGTPVQSWLQKLRGELKIDIPRNTWLRGPELNAEISGGLEFIQESLDKFSLFGTLSIIRGTYELYGKKFDIEKGQITFEGDWQKPQFELAANHVFRAATADREKKNLEVKISGELTNPKIEFLQNGNVLEEKDALANLVFGVDFEQLLYNQRVDLQNEPNVYSTAAMGLLSGLVSQELAQSLGRSLNLDLIEFQSSGEDITKSSVLVGKYLTDNLFISFGQEPEGRVVSLEWELLKFLFLQAAHGGEENRKSGFDLIWKWDW